MSRIWQVQWWILVGALLGATLLAMNGVLLMRDAHEIAEAFTSALGPRAKVRASVSILFGLFKIENTHYPYLWTALNAALVGGVVGAIVGWIVHRVMTLTLRRGTS